MSRGLKSQWNFLCHSAAFRRRPLLVLMRLAVWYLRCLLGLSATLRLRQWGVRMVVPAEKRGVAKLLYAFHECYDDALPHLLARLSMSDTFVDVGANYGVYAIAAAPRAHQVIAFEPGQKAFAALRANVRVNTLGNVVLCCAALSDQPGTATLYCGPDSSRNSLGDWDETCAVETVPVDTLSHSLGRMGVERVDVVKVDVEGAEELVLRGGREIIARHHPAILFEINASAALALGLSPQGAAHFLATLGYEFFCFTAEGELQPVNDPYAWNTVALHPESHLWERWGLKTDAARPCLVHQPS